MSEQKKILELRKLKKYFTVNRTQKLKAVEDISFVMYEGEKFAVVGESGCGKSTLGRTILQLFKQTSGSCVYYGKSIQELNPRYIREEIANLPKYQQDAKDFYQKSLEVDKKIEGLQKEADALDPDGSSKDARKFDQIQKKIDRLSYEAQEHRKDAARQLREGSRTIGSLILSPDLDKIAELFNKAEDEVHLAYETLEKYKKLKNIYDDNATILSQSLDVNEWIAIEEAKKERSEQENLHLKDLKEIKKKVDRSDLDKLRKDNEDLEKQMQDLLSEVGKHHDIEMAYRQEAFDKYHGVNYLPITERALDKTYQERLDGNYETGINLSKLNAKELRMIRPDLQMVFQDPAASLDPRQSIGKSIEEVFEIHTDLSKLARREKTLELIQKVGLKPEHYYSYPNALSGGMKQRVGIARAIALEPSFVVLDEAVSALDVSVQAQILQLLNELQAEKKLTYMFITHDLGVVKHFCDRVMVMYLGNVCELADNTELFNEPLHPYTRSLLEAVPRMRLDRKENEEDILQGEVPSPLDPPSGCPFHTRCKECMEICRQKKPEGIQVKENHLVYCHLYDQEEA